MSAASDCDALVLAQWRAKGLDYAADVVEQLRAERQQAIDERDEARDDLAKWDKTATAEIGKLKAQLQQAIDALRYARMYVKECEQGSPDVGDWPQSLALLRTALVSLGETE